MKRPDWSHKGDFGTVLIVAGSDIYTGTPFFNAMGAWRSGADLVHLTGHVRAMDTVAVQAPEIITHPLKGNLSKREVSGIATLAQMADVVLLGGGLPRTAAIHETLRLLIQKIKKPLILDAEGIRALKGHTALLKGKTALLTPHKVEFEVLTGEKLENTVKDRSEKVRAWAKKLGATILLKGHVDIISDGKTVLLNKTGIPAMTKGGTGDTLAGLCTGYMSQGLSPLKAALEAARQNGLAGQRAFKKHGSGFTVKEMVEEI